jgi:hypothetical protein
VADADIDTGPGSDGPDGRSEPLISAEGLAGITRALGWLLAIAAAALAATGVPLIFLYRPDGVGWLRGAHNVASTLFLGAAAGTVAVLGVAAARRLRVPPGWLVALGLLATALVGLVSGQLIGWDRLAMDGVADASGVRGILDALSGDVRAVVVEGTEVSRGAYAAWAAVHVLAVPLLVLGVGWTVRRRARSR